MKNLITARQCLEVMGDLAEMLPPLLAERRSFPQFPFEDELDDYIQRERWDPVFTGGGIVSLLITDPAAPPPSLTKDVDLVLEICNWMEFADMEQILRNAGLRQMTEAGLIVAWEWRGIRVDFLPHQPIPQIETTNRWFPYLLNEAQYIEVLPGKSAWVASAPCFLATKLEAFNNRGYGDYLSSKDIEDVLAVIDGRTQLLEEISVSDPNVRGFLSQYSQRLLSDRRFLDAIPLLLGDSDREDIALEKLRKIYSLG